MKSKKLKILYDKESGVLSFKHSGAKSVDSDVSGNIVIDYDKKGDVVGVDFHDFNFNSFRIAEKGLKGFSKQARVPISMS